MRLRLLVTVFFLAASVSAHDLFLVVEGSGDKRKVCARIGEHFPESMNAIPANRIALFRAHRDMGKKRDLVLLPPEPMQTCASGILGTAGGSTFDDLVVEMTVNPNFIRLTAKDFQTYIEGEGFKDVIAIRKQKGQSGSEGRELYSRYAKLVLPGGRQGTERLGHALEIVPEKSPNEIKPGENLPVRLFFLGKPLAGVRVSAVYAGAKLEGHSFPVSVVTDKDGRAQLPIERPGLWYARLIHMIPAENDPEVDWRSFFSTLTFEIPAKK